MNLCGLSTIGFALRKKMIALNMLRLSSDWRGNAKDWRRKSGDFGKSCKTPNKINKCVSTTYLHTSSMISRKTEWVNASVRLHPTYKSLRCTLSQIKEAEPNTIEAASSLQTVTAANFSNPPWCSSPVCLGNSCWRSMNGMNPFSQALKKQATRSVSWPLSLPVSQMSRSESHR